MKLRFDFKDHCYQFSEPVQVIETHSLDHVVAKLQEVEQAVQAGFYAAGYLAYEAASAFRPYYQTAKQGEMPLLWFAIFSAADDLTDEPEKATCFPASDWQAQTSIEHYQAAIRRIQQEIAAGNSYQVNYTLRLTSPMDSESLPDSEPFYRYLLNAQQANYSAYLDLGAYQILSASPELFFHWQHDQITTKPMKGTARRGTTQQQDRIQRQKLRTSSKDQAENVMIVDLLRNDLSQIAEPGSVKVDTLFEVEKYPTVWQMTSTISAKTHPHTTLTDLFRALFPCGSITGAPKTSTMRLIAELEAQPREVYCGAIGFMTPQREALFSVPIRTVTINRQQQIMHYGVGGGITWDSAAQDEYQETVDKAQILHGVKLPTQLLESLLLQDGRYTLLDYHLQRLADSADYFDFNYHPQQVMRALNDLAQQHQQADWKVRLLLDKQGAITLQASAILTETSPLSARWSPFKVTSTNRLLYHKTTERSHYPDVTLNHEYLLYNERDEITEFVNGNVALLLEGEWQTPRQSCGLLAGTLRQSLLESGQLTEAIIARSQLSQATKIAFINSVRGWREVVWCGEC